MGYIHSWTHVMDIPARNWWRIQTAARLLFQNLPARSESAGGYYSGYPLQLGGPSGEPEGPVVAADYLVFNGREPRRADRMLLTRSPLPPPPFEDADLVTLEGCRQEYCQTNRYPYDLVVCGLLIVVHRFGGGAVTPIHSEGTAADWQPALQWVTATLGDGYRLPPAVLGQPVLAPRYPPLPCHLASDAPLWF